MDDNELDTLSARLEELRLSIEAETKRLYSHRLRNAALEIGVDEDKLCFVERLLDRDDNDPAGGDEEDLRGRVSHLLRELPSLGIQRSVLPLNPGGAETGSKEARLRDARERRDIKSIVALKLGGVRRF